MRFGVLSRLLLDIALGNSWMSSSINENTENTRIRDSISNKIELLNRIRFQHVNQVSLRQINTVFVPHQH